MCNSRSHLDGEIQVVQTLETSLVAFVAVILRTQWHLGFCCLRRQRVATYFVHTPYAGYTPQSGKPRDPQDHAASSVHDGTLANFTPSSHGPDHQISDMVSKPFPVNRPTELSFAFQPTRVC